MDINSAKYKLNDGKKWQYIKLKRKAEEVDLFSEEDMGQSGTQPISHDDYEKLITYLEKKNPSAVLPIQIAYYAGLRIGEVCGLTWQDINLEEQYLTVKRSVRYDGAKHKTIIGPTKRKKVRVVDFGETLTAILKKARKEQLKNQMQYGELYHRNYYKEVQDKNRVYYEYYSLENTQDNPADYNEISFVCLRPDGCLETPSTMNCCDFFLNVMRKTSPYYLPPPRLGQKLTEAQR